MDYVLGVDLGTTTIMAGTYAKGHASAVSLGTEVPTVPAITRLSGPEPSSWVSGPEADDPTQPGERARHVKREVGREYPLLLGQVAALPEAIMKHQLQWVLERCSEQLDGTLRHITLTHPAHWNETQHEAFLSIAADLDPAMVGFTTEPDAAASYFAAHHDLPVGKSLVVFDFGGGTTDVAVLYRAAHRFEPRGRAIGNNRLGGIDLTDEIVEELRRSRSELAALNDATDAGRRARAEFFLTVRQAKEQLSIDQSVDIPLPGGDPNRPHRLTRSDLEALVGPLIDEAVDLIPEAIDAAGIHEAEIHGVLLAGGSSRMPLVGAHIQSQLGFATLSAGDPKNAVGMGAAMTAAATVGLRESTKEPIVGRTTPRALPVDLEQRGLSGAEDIPLSVALVSGLRPSSRPGGFVAPSQVGSDESNDEFAQLPADRRLAALAAVVLLIVVVIVAGLRLAAR